MNQLNKLNQITHTSGYSFKDNTYKMSLSTITKCQIGVRRDFILNVSKRQLSSISRTTKTSPPSCDGENILHNSGESISSEKLNLQKSSYKPINLAYISYEKKSQDKVRILAQTYLGGGQELFCPF